MNFARLRNIVDTLKRKYATELAVYRARPLALELCDRMADAVAPGRPKSSSTCLDYAFGLFTRLNEKGIRVRSHMGLYNYLSGCLDKLLLPQVNDVLRSLFPKAREKGLIPRSRIEVPFNPRREWNSGMGYCLVALADRIRAAKARGIWREPDPDPLPSTAAAIFRHRPRVPYLPASGPVIPAKAGIHTSAPPQSGKSFNPVNPDSDKNQGNPDSDRNQGSPIIK